MENSSFFKTSDLGCSAEVCQKIFDFFYAEFTAGVYRHDFELTRDSKGFGIFIEKVFKKSEDAEILSQKWTEKSFKLLDPKSENFDLTPFF